MNRHFGYLRVSSEEQKEQQTIRGQLEAMERYAALHGLEWAGLFADDGVSGSVYHLRERPEGQRLLQAVRPGDAVYVSKIDRLGRGIRKILTAVDELESRGAMLRSLTEPVDTGTSAGRFLLNMLASAAEYDRDSIVDRLTEGVRRKARDGGWTGGLPPYGYRVEGQRREAVLAPEEDVRPGETFGRADVVRLCYRLTLEEGWTTKRIADYLNGLGIPTTHPPGSRISPRSGNPNLGTWSASRICALLLCPVYRGERDFGKRSPRETIRRPCPALVPAEVWQQAQRLISGRRCRSEADRSRWLLSGLLWCGQCGGRYHARLARARETEYRYYVCGSFRRHAQLYAGAASCPSPPLPATCEAEVWERCRWWIEHPEAVDEWLAAQEAAQPEPRQVDERAALEIRVAALEAERKRLLTLYRRGIIGDADLEEQLAEVRDEEAALRVRLLESGPADLTAARQLAASARERLTLLRGTLQEADTPELRRRVLVAVGPRLRVALETSGGRLRGRVEFSLF